MDIQKLHHTQGVTSIGGVEMIQLWKIHGWLVRVTVNLGSTVQSSSGVTEVVNVDRILAVPQAVVIMAHADGWYHQAKSPDHGQYEVMNEVAAKLATATEQILVEMYGYNCDDAEEGTGE